MISFIYRFMLFTLLMPNWGLTQSFRNLQYKEANSIEIKIGGINTILYPDKLKPQSVFWYEPGELHIERRKSGEKSRLSFSMEIHSNGELNSSETKEHFITLNMVISSNYDTFFKNKLKRKLVSMGYTVIHPFDPLKSYELIELKPINSKISNIVLDEIFIEADWKNKKEVYKNAFLDKPFPVQLELGHYDATLFLESLVKKRTQRVGRVVYGNNRHIPIFLNIDLIKTQLPIDIGIEKQEDNWIVTFSNPTEHNILLQRFTYFSQALNQWITKVIDCELDGYNNNKNSPPFCKIVLSEQPHEIKEIDWLGIYNYSMVLKEYIKNITPAKPTEIIVLKNHEGLSNNKSNSPIIDSLSMELKLVDNLGIVHNKFYKFKNSFFENNTSNKISFFINSIGGAKLTTYRFSAHTPLSRYPLISSWKKYSEDFIGDKLIIEIQPNLLDLFSVDNGNLYNSNAINKAVHVEKLESTKDIQYLLIPKLLKVAKTSNGNPKIELRVAQGKLQGFFEFYFPIFPNTFSQARDSFGENFKISTPNEISLTLLIDSLVVFQNKKIIADNRGHFIVRFSTEDINEELLLKGIKNKKRILAIVTSDIYTKFKDLRITNLQFPFE